MIYLDYAATSIKREEILEYILKNKEDFDANPASSHAGGRRSRKVLEESRQKIAKSINAKKDQIIFTAGASESNNQVLNYFKDDKKIVSNIEHDSILNTIDDKNTLYLKADEDGLVSLDELKEMLDDSIKLVSIMYVNNEMGAIEPIIEIGQYLKDKDTYFHVDCVQAYGHIDIDVEKLNCDFISLSGHKIGGLNGFGILYSRGKIDPFIKGGEQEKDRRAGTSFVMGAYSMAESFEKMIEEREKIGSIKKYFLEKLDKSDVEYEVNGSFEKSVDHILNLYFPNLKADFLLTYMDLAGICASAGSACRAGTMEPSRVISNLFDKKRAERSIRFSFGYTNTFDEIDRVVDVIREVS